MTPAAIERAAGRDCLPALYLSGGAGTLKRLGLNFA